MNKGKSKERLYDLVEERRNVKKKSNPLDEAIDDEDRELAREAKRLRLQEIVAERKKRLKELKGSEEGVAGSQGAPPSLEAESLVKALLADPKVQKQWLEYSEEQRGVLLAAVGTLLASGQHPGSIGSAWPLMMVAMRQNPSSSVKDVVELIKVVSPPQQATTSKDILEAIRVGLEVGGKKEVAGGEDMFSKAMEFLKPVYETLSQKDKALYDAKLQNLQNQIVDPVEFLDRAVKLAEKYGSKGELSPELKLKLKEMEMAQKDRELELRKWAIQMDREDQRQERLMGIIGQTIPTAATFGVEALKERKREGYRPAPRQKMRRPPPPKEGPLTSACWKCGESFTINPPYPEEFVCPKCKSVNKVTIEYEEEER